MFSKTTPLYLTLGQFKTAWDKARRGSQCLSPQHSGEKDRPISYELEVYIKSLRPARATEGKMFQK